MRFRSVLAWSLLLAPMTDLGASDAWSGGPVDPCGVGSVAQDLSRGPLVRGEDGLLHGLGDWVSFKTEKGVRIPARITRMWVDSAGLPQIEVQAIFKHENESISVEQPELLSEKGRRSLKQSVTSHKLFEVWDAWNAERERKASQIVGLDGIEVVKGGFVSFELGDGKRVPARIRSIQRAGGRNWVEVSEIRTSRDGGAKLFEHHLDDRQIASLRQSQTSRDAFGAHPELMRVERRYPPIGREDTVIFDPKTGKSVSLHTGGKQINLFDDSEILEVHAPSRVTQVQGVEIGYNENGRAVIQQQGIRACTSAAANMLIADYGLPIDVRALRETNLAHTAEIWEWLEQAGLKPMISQVRSFEQFSTLLAAHGPAILTVSDARLGAHVVVIDSLDLQARTARIRDPWHGWDITVPISALESRWARFQVIQVEGRMPGR